MNDETMWRVRATAWELAALSFRYPNEELAGAVASGEWDEAAEEVLAALGVGPAVCEPVRAAAGAGEAGEVLHALRPEATRLFVGAPEPAASPYEGMWAAHADGVQALLFVNPRSVEVERFVSACGLGSLEGSNEPLDHVAAECALLSHLALRAAGAEPPEGAPVDSDLPGGSAAAAYESFLEGHARSWMPAFADAVAAEARLPFYRAAAAYLKALVG